MRGVNRVFLVATLGSDPEIKALPNGNMVANISAVTTEKWRDKVSGEDREEKEWHRIVIFGRLAETCQQYLKKASTACFEGRIRTRSWEKDGIKRYSTEVVAHSMTMLGGKGQDSGDKPARGHTDAPAPASGNTSAGDDGFDSLPFLPANWRMI